MNWYKKAQEVYRGDPSPLDLKDFDPEYGTKQLGKELGSSLAYGPGIYFVSKKEYAQYSGSNISRYVINGANILSEKSPKFSPRQIEKILNNIDRERLIDAISNIDENFNLGKRKLIQMIVNEENPIDQLMGIWADVFYHQNPQMFMDVMENNGIDGILREKDDATYYAIYNRDVLK